MVLKKSGRGSLGRNERRRKRLQTDKKYREKRHEIKENYRLKNKEKIAKARRIWTKKLTEFRNRKCKECNKLLDYRTKGDYCKKHIWLGK